MLAAFRREYVKPTAVFLSSAVIVSLAVACVLPPRYRARAVVQLPDYDSARFMYASLSGSDVGRRVVEVQNLVHVFGVRGADGAYAELQHITEPVLDVKLFTVSVDIVWHDAIQAASIANAYIDALRELYPSVTAVRESEERAERLVAIGTARQALEKLRVDGYRGIAYDAALQSAVRAYIAAKVSADRYGELVDRSRASSSAACTPIVAAWDAARAASARERRTLSAYGTGSPVFAVTQEAVDTFIAAELSLVGQQQALEDAAVAPKPVLSFHTIEPAVPPTEPVGPDRPLIVIVTAVVGFGLALLGTGISEWRRKNLAAGSDGERVR
jgi:hypothetical protein